MKSSVQSEAFLFYFLVTFFRNFQNILEADNFLENQFTQIRSKSESCFVSILFLTNFEILTHLKVEIICFRNSLYGRRDRSVKSSVQSETFLFYFLVTFFRNFQSIFEANDFLRKSAYPKLEGKCEMFKY